jgi:hypothetical protein
MLTLLKSGSQCPRGAFHLTLKEVYLERVGPELILLRAKRFFSASRTSTLQSERECFSILPVFVSSKSGKWLTTTALSTFFS